MKKQAAKEGKTYKYVEFNQLGVFSPFWAWIYLYIMIL